MAAVLKEADLSNKSLWPLSAQAFLLQRWHEPIQVSATCLSPGKCFWSCWRLAVFSECFHIFVSVCESVTPTKSRNHNRGCIPSGAGGSPTPQHLHPYCALVWHVACDGMLPQLEECIGIGDLLPWMDRRHQEPLRGCYCGGPACWPRTLQTAAALQWRRKSSFGDLLLLTTMCCHGDGALACWDAAHFPVGAGEILL